MKKTILLLSLLVFLISAYFLVSYRTKESPAQNTPAEQQSQTMPSIPSTQNESMNNEVATNEIINALAEKNNWDVSTVEVSITSSEGNFAKGSVGIKNEMGDGMWFAARDNNAWEIVYDGNGIIPCNALEEYPDYPTSFIPECFDTEKDVLIER